MVEADPEQTAVDGGNASLTCHVMSSPPPRIRWYRVEDGEDDVVLLESQEYDDEDFGVYEILNVTENDAGTYRCLGQWSHGYKAVDIELVVLSELMFTHMKSFINFGFKRSCKSDVCQL